MKKFGKGFVLDFAALMDEVHQPPDGDPNRPPCVPSSASVESTEGSPAPDDYTRSLSYGSAGSTSATSPVDPMSPSTDEGSPEFSENRRSKPTRMSVSRTGRCKNRDRQRLTVLQSDDFYRNPASDAGKATASSSSVENSKTVGGERKPDRDPTKGEANDLDSAIKALDSSIQPQVMADCYSF